MLDVDGTLVGDADVVSPRNREALTLAGQAGCTVALCTARTRYTVHHVVDQVGATGYAVLCNGAVLANLRTGSEIVRLSIPLHTVADALGIAREAGLAAMAYGADSECGRYVHVARYAPLWPPYATANRDRLVYCDDLVAELPAEPLGMTAYGSETSTAYLAKQWRARLRQHINAFHGPSLFYGCWAAYFVSGRASKAFGAARLAQILDIPASEVLAIGDHLNDSDLLRWAGLGICMGDGHPDVRAVADHVTGTLVEDGVAQAIEQFAL